MAGKKYSINWENGEAVSFEIDGVVYTSLDQITDPKDLGKMTAMMDAAEEEDFFEEESTGAVEKPSYPFEKIILLIFSGVAALLILIALIASASNISTLLNERSASGRVVDIVLRREYVNEQDRIIQEYYFPVVNFTADDGRQRAVQMSVGSSSPEYEKGDEVTVLYNPQHPLDARIKSFGSSAMMWILPSITGVLGITFLGAVLMVRKVFLPDEKKKDKDKDKDPLVTYPAS
jgi:hypothetical protein